MSDIITLKENWAFSRAYRSKNYYVSPLLVTYIVKNRKSNLQIGITTSKKIGNAVERARCRRIIRAAFNKIKDNLEPGYDIVFVARTKTVKVKSTDILTVMQKHLQSAGVIKDEKNIY